MTLNKSLLLAPAFLLFASPAFAVGNSTLPSGAPERRELRENVRQEIKTELKDKLGEVRSNIAGNHATRLEHRFSVYYQRLSNIATRLNSNLATLKSAGKDTSSAETKLSTAKTTLESAKAKGAEAVAAFKAIDPAKWSEQKDQAIKARDLANAARKLFEQSHTEFASVITAIKAIKGGE